VCVCVFVCLPCLFMWLHVVSVTVCVCCIFSEMVQVEQVQGTTGGQSVPGSASVPAGTTG